jgi:site-specific DNA-methyltransferase (adenine-specific)
MGKSWDYDVPSADTWRAVLRVLKPGAPLVAFGGSRTYHRLACAVEDAGFELRDCLMWLHGKGFPKSLDVSKAIDKSAGATRETDLAKLWHGYGTALKPAHEPIVFARKPLDGTVAQNVQKWGVGGLAIDACRSEDAGGRWPANLVLDEEAGALLDASVGDRPSRPSVTRNGGGGGMLPLAVLPGTPRPDSGYSDSGGPSRFFYCVKVSTREREAGCEGLALRTAGEVTGDRAEGSDGLESPRAGAGRTGGARNHHPTLKPLSLTTWLAKLVLPPAPGAVLVPFAGAGSEVIGCGLAGWPHVVGVERDRDDEGNVLGYAAIARTRIAHWLKKKEEET